MKRRTSLFAGIFFSIIFEIAIMPYAGPATAIGPEQSAISGIESSSVEPEVAPLVSQSIKNDISKPLGSMEPIPPSYQPEMRVVPLFGRTPPPFELHEPDPVVQNFFTPADLGYKGPLLNIPVTIEDFPALSNGDNSAGVLPPDTNGDVGLTHYVQWVNTVFAIYNKSGVKLFGPAAGNSLWSGFGPPCQTQNDGDIIALYDRQADRWLMSQFALPNYPSGPFYQCIAISQTGDPTGSWYRYAFLFSNTKMNDYPKFGIWPDGYYMSANQYTSGSLASAGAGVVVFERSKMLQGLAAQMVYFDLSASHPQLFGLLPSHLNGPNAPPGGSPNYFVKFDDNALGFPADQLEVWGFHVDWTTTGNSTFSPIATLPTASFDSNLCNYGINPDCVPQPGTAVGVDAIPDRLMYRLQYRNFGPYEAMVVNHTVNTGSNHAGIRWYELRNSGNGWGILQQGTYSPDSDHRWMGSAALDGMGNFALGYSVSSGTTYPSVRYTGRLSTDTLNTLPQGEGTIISGGGSQTSTSYRWGDYSSMSIDPFDDVTFWYTQEYYSSTSNHSWQTRVGAFSLCSLDPARTQGPVYSLTLQEAYGNAASSGDTILAQSVTFRENLVLNGNKAITLTGGYDCIYSANSLRTTLIGSLTVSTGSVIVENISIQ